MADRNSARNPALMTYLTNRGSVSAMKLGAPAPSEAELTEILSAAARVPDHGRLEPWRFIVIEGPARGSYAERLIEIWRANNPDADEEALANERRKRGLAPAIVVVVSRAAEHPKIPVWEQQLSVGAVCTNFLHAANASGFSAQWLTGWPAFDADVATLLGLQPDEKVAGFMHIGTAEAEPIDRSRPDIGDLTSRWTG